MITIFFSRLTVDFCEELFFENVVFDLLCDVGWMPAKAFVPLSQSILGSLAVIGAGRLLARGAKSRNRGVCSQHLLVVSLQSVQEKILASNRIVTAA